MRRSILVRFKLGLLVSAGLPCLACADDDSDAEVGEVGQLRGLDDGLELDWTFENHVGAQILDVSGNGRHGTLNGGSFVSSPEGEAVSLDGVDDYVSLTHLGLRDPSLYGGVDGDFTISARVRVADVNKLNSLCYGCGPFSSMFIGTASPGATVLSGVFNQQTNGTLWPSSSASLADDEWREVTMVVEGGVGARYYLDCGLDDELQDANVGLKNYGFSAVGLGSSADRWYGGEIDRLRVWSRALTEQELGDLCTPQPVQLGQGLELNWTFEDHDGDQITDVSGNGRHGTLQGAALVSSPTGKAASLDGVDDSIALTHLGLRDPSLYGGVDGEFTISARVRVANVNKLNTLCSGCGPFSSMFVGTATPGATVLSALFNQQTNGTLWASSSAALSNDEWREVTLVVDGGATARYYLDCEFDTALANANIGLKDYGFSAVGQGSTADRWYGGEIDQLRVWSRALTDQELAQLCPLEAGLQLHWTFEDHVGAQITDVSGNGRHGTLQGGALVSAPKGEAASLDGVDDYISLAHLGLREPSLYGGVAGDFTISARVRVDDANKLNSLCYGCGPFASMFVGTASPGATVLSGLFNQQTNGTLWPSSSAALADDEWREVTMVVDGGVAARYYLDCGLDSELQNPNIGLKNYNFSAVGLGSSADRWYGGEIDELRIWDRALANHELAQLCGCLGPIHVDVDAPAGGDGQSWATAFNDLQAAIDAGSECGTPQIWVAEGSYAPDPNAPVATITAPVAIYGGFAGTETALEQRDVVAHPTVLGAPGWESRVVVIEDTAVNEVDLLRLDGFTIDGSNAGAIELTNMGPLDPPITVFLHNLELTNNVAQDGAGVLVNGNASGIELVNVNFEGNEATGAGAAMYFTDNSEIEIHESSFIANQSPKAAIYQLDTEFSFFGKLEIVDSVMSGNVGGAVRARSVRPTNVEFNGNSGGGAAIQAEGMVVTSCSFLDNAGGAISGAYVNVVDSSFSGNSASRGGAVVLLDGWQAGSLIVSGSSFVDNSATGAYGGGAIYVAHANVDIQGSSFVNNVAAVGGALHGVDSGWAPPTMTISDSRFIANEATTANGGGLAISLWEGSPDPDITVINSEFVGNLAAGDGGGIYGRSDLVATTFANNLAAGQPQALSAPSGPAMEVRSVVAWPDELAADSMVLDHSCVPAVAQPHTDVGSVFIVADPFAPADLDLDGLSEWYLDPGSACVDIGGTVGEFDWTTMTTQASQCTDTAPLDAGVHYTPLSTVGPC